MKALVAPSAAAPADMVRVVSAALGAVEGAEVRRVDLGRMGSTGSRLGRVVKAIMGESEAGVLVRELSSMSPEVAVALDPAAAAALVLARDRKVSPTPVVAVVPELAPSEAWSVNADRFAVVNDEAAVALSERGVDGARVIVVGPLTGRAQYEASREPKAKLREAHKLPADQPVLLVEVAGMSGEFLSQTMLQLGLVAAPMVVLFDASDDAGAAEGVRRLVTGLGLRAKLFGATPKAAQLWRAADVVVARPTPRAIHRALAAGCAFVSLEPGSPEESAEAQALVDRRLGATVNKVLLLAGTIDTLLADPRMRGRAAGRVVTDGASGVAELCAEVAAAREEVLAETAAAAEEASVAEEAAEEAARLEREGPADEVEDFGDEWAPPPKAGTDAAIREKLDAAEGRARKELDESRLEAEKWEQRAQMAKAKGDATLARQAAQEADRKRARMHTALEELKRLARERQHLGAAPPPRAPAPPVDTLDDALSKLKARAGGPGKGPRTVEDELSALKRKMEADKRRK